MGHSGSIFIREGSVNQRTAKMLKRYGVQKRLNPRHLKRDWNSRPARRRGALRNKILVVLPRRPPKQQAIRAALRGAEHYDESVVEALEGLPSSGPDLPCPEDDEL